MYSADCQSFIQQRCVCHCFTNFYFVSFFILSNWYAGCVCVRENVGSNECKDVELCSVGSQMKWNKGKKEKKTLMMMKRFTLYYIRCSDYDSIPKQQNDRISCKKVSFFELMFKLPCTHQYCIIAEKFVKIKSIIQIIQYAELQPNRAKTFVNSETKSNLNQEMIPKTYFLKKKQKVRFHSNVMFVLVLSSCGVSLSYSNCATLIHWDEIKTIESEIVLWIRQFLYNAIQRQSYISSKQMIFFGEYRFVVFLLCFPTNESKLDFEEVFTNSNIECMLASISGLIWMP